jgi:hypothetical protein
VAGANLRGGPWPTLRFQKRAHLALQQTVAGTVATLILSRVPPEAVTVAPPPVGALKNCQTGLSGSQQFPQGHIELSKLGLAYPWWCNPRDGEAVGCCISGIEIQRVGILNGWWVGN